MTDQRITSAPPTSVDRLVDTPHGAIFVKELPGIEPAIVLLQASRRPLDLQPAMPLLAPHRVIALDVLGYGRSDRAESGAVSPAATAGSGIASGWEPGMESSTPACVVSRRLELPLVPWAAVEAVTSGRRLGNWADDFPAEGDVVIARLLHAAGRHTAATAEDAFWGHRQVIERSTGKVIGGVGFFGPPVNGVAEIGYGIVPSRRGAGYAPEAVSALIAAAWRHGSLRAVIANTDRGQHRVPARPREGRIRRGRRTRQATLFHRPPALRKEHIVKQYLLSVHHVESQQLPQGISQYQEDLYAQPAVTESGAA